MLRLRNQQIASEQAKSPAEVVRYMGAMQAQDYYGSLWALGLRSQSSEKDIIRAIEDTEIVRTWPQRGTLHFVPAEDATWLVGLSAERLLRGARRRREQLGLDDTVLARSKAILVQVLADVKRLSRPEVMDVLEKAGISTKAGRGYHILWYLSQTGVTYIGPMEGKQQTVALLGAQIINLREFTRQRGIIELTKRYFTSHGPATLQDFMWWSGLTATDARAGLEANTPLLTSEVVGNNEYWLAKDALHQNVAVPESFLLPGFDEYLLGYKDRSAVLHTEYAQRVVPGGNGMFLPTIIIDGRVVGTWKRIIKKDHVLVTLSPFKSLPKSSLKSLQAPADQYGRFLGLPVKSEGSVGL